MSPVRHAYGPHPAQFGELSLPDGRVPAGTVVLVHGGFWRARYDLSLARPLAADLVARGHAVWNLEYRRVGAGGGWPATPDDVAAGIDALAELPVDAARVVAVGHSAGGHLAVWAAGRAVARVPLTGVVAQAGVLDLARCAAERLGDGAVQELLGGEPADVADRYAAADPLAAVPLPVPVLCVHAPGDRNVPQAQSRAYVAAATARGGRARLIEAAGDHFTLIDPAAPDWRLARAALDELLAG